MNCNVIRSRGRIIACLMCLMVSFSAYAEVTVTGTIGRLMNFEWHGGPLVTLSNMSPTAGLCPRNDYYILPLTHKYFAQDYALLLSAKIANRPVGIAFENGDCFDQMPRVRHIFIDN